MCENVCKDVYVIKCKLGKLLCVYVIIIINFIFKVVKIGFEILRELNIVIDMCIL